jgi:hypothetical protein
MFLVGSWGQMISMIITFACLILGTTCAANGAVFGLFLFLFSFGSTWLELPWLYPAEINPLRTRTNANAVSALSNWLFQCVLFPFSLPSLFTPSPTSFPYSTPYSGDDADSLLSPLPSISFCLALANSQLRRRPVHSSFPRRHRVGLLPFLRRLERALYSCHLLLLSVSPVTPLHHSARFQHTNADPPLSLLFPPFLPLPRCRNRRKDPRGDRPSVRSLSSSSALEQ